MFGNTDVISIGSDSEEDDMPYVRKTRSQTRLNRTRKTTLKANRKKTESIDLTEKLPETSQKKRLVIDGDINITFDDDSDDELEENIRVMWTKNTEIKRFFLKPSQTLHSVFEELSKIYNLPTENIRIRNKDRIISMYDVLKSLSLKVTDVLEAYAIEENTVEDLKTFSKDKIEVKCLFENSKKPLVFYLHPKQNLSCLLELCAKEVNSSADQLEMKFDGDKVLPNDTPSSLDLEGGECLEVYIVK